MERGKRGDEERKKGEVEKEEKKGNGEGKEGRWREEKRGNGKGESEPGRRGGEKGSLAGKLRAGSLARRGARRPTQRGWPWLGTRPPPPLPVPTVPARPRKIQRASSEVAGKLQEPRSRAGSAQAGAPWHGGHPGVRRLGPQVGSGHQASKRGTWAPRTAPLEGPLVP